jgi:hypothetical protein
VTDGSGQIWLDNVSCNGTENPLWACSSNTWGDNNCSASKDIGVGCDPWSWSSTAQAGALKGIQLVDTNYTVTSSWGT